jgi:S1-C subfamily serine protease
MLKTIRSGSLIAITTIAMLVFVYLSPADSGGGGWVKLGGMYFKARDMFIDADSQITQKIKTLKEEQEKAKTEQPPLNGIVKVVKKSKPAVVTIATQQGIGSGFLIDPEGFILTNAHVVGANKVVLVVFNNDLQVFADVIKVRQEFDAALLKVQFGANYPFLKLGDVDKSMEGETVIAIGSPKGLESTATSGIISSIRKFPQITIIQTDTAVNQGNSGGPLLNKRGEVIGIVTAKAVQSLKEVFEGLSTEGLNFAVSINDARRLWTD